MPLGKIAPFLGKPEWSRLGYVPIAVAEKVLRAGRD